MTASTGVHSAPLDSTLDWRPMPEVWAEIVAEHPDLHLGATATAQNNFRNSYGPELVEAGIISRGMGRSWWVNRRRFKPAFRLLIAGRPLSELDSSGVSVPSQSDNSHLTA
jgi:hypothetical protein